MIKANEPFIIYLHGNYNELECEGEYGADEDQAGELAHLEVKLLIYFDDSGEIQLLEINDRTIGSAKHE